MSPMSAEAPRFPARHGLGPTMAVATLSASRFQRVVDRIDSSLA